MCPVCWNSRQWLCMVAGRAETRIEATCATMSELSMSKQQDNFLILPSLRPLRLCGENTNPDTTSCVAYTGHQPGPTYTGPGHSPCPHANPQPAFPTVWSEWAKGWTVTARSV